MSIILPHDLSVLPSNNCFVLQNKSGKYQHLTRALSKNIKKQALFLLKVDRRIKWMGAGMFCFALFSLLSFVPEITERYYAQGIFIVVRYIYDYTLGLLPFSPTIWFNLIFISWFSYKAFKYIRFNINNTDVSLYNRVQYSVLSAMSFLGKLSVLFFVGWGFNYQRVPIEEYTQIGIQSLSPQEIVVEANIARKLTLQAREAIEGLPMNKVFSPKFLPADLETEMRENLESVFHYMSYPTPGKVRCRSLENDYWLRKIGYTGMYVSFYGEALVSSHIASVFKPFFYAHEMAHAFGFFDEADANFLAYLACEQSSNPAIVYSGRLAHLIYLRHEFQLFNMRFPDAILTDLQSHGAFSSQEQYNRMILLVHAWRSKYPLKPVKPIKAYREEAIARNGQKPLFY